MGNRAVKAFGRAGGAGATGSEEELSMAGENATGTTTTQTTTTGNNPDPAIAGGPGVGDQQQPPAFKFSYNNKEFKTEQELTDYLSGLDTEITTLKTRKVETPPPAVVTPPVVAAPSMTGPKSLEQMSEEELVAELLSNPKRVLQAVKGEVRAESQAQIQAQKNIESMWGEFWDKNKELKKFEPIVKMVFDANQTALGPMLMKDVPAKLAELSRSASLAGNKEALTPF